MSARHHHYLSQCYLRGFTSGNGKKSKLLVFDFKERKHFPTIPRNVGGIRDFNRIDIEGFPPNLFETQLAKFESVAATALKKVDEGAPFEGHNKDVILNLLAMLASRSPQRRESWNKIHTQIAEIIMGMSLATEDRWESQLNQMKADGLHVNDSVSYQDMKKFADSKEYNIEVAREHHIRMEMVAVDAILPYLAGRKWHTVRTDINSNPFITTDNPVVLLWKDPDAIPPFHRNNPGYAMPDTQVFFPISSSVAVVGEFDGENKTTMADELLVANINTIFLNRFHRQIYVPKLGFKFVDLNGSIVDGRTLIKLL